MDDFWGIIGFAFSENKDSVLLIREPHPKWIKGCFNGIRGKIEDGEMIDDAMNRRCVETTGLSLQWKHCGIMVGEDDGCRQFECHVFYAHDNKILDFKQIKDESLIVCDIENIKSEKGVPYHFVANNLNLLISFGIHNDNIKFFTLEMNKDQ